MGLLDDAIREHLDLKRRRGADPSEIERMEHEALGPVRREPVPVAESAVEYAAPPAVESDHFFTEEALTEVHQHGNGAHHAMPAVDEVFPLDYEGTSVEHDVPFVEHQTPPAVESHDSFPPDAEGPATSVEHEGTELESGESAGELPDELKIGPPVPRRRGFLRRRSGDTERDQADAEREAFMRGLGTEREALPTNAADTAPVAPDTAPVAPDAPPHLEFASPAANPPRATEPAAQDDPSPDELQRTAEHDIAAEFAAEDRGEHVTGTDHAAAGADRQTTADDHEGPAQVDEDVLEETPEFLQDTPDHDRLWFEQKPPRDFDFDD